MPERLKGHDWKSCVRAKLVPRVQIPLSPPDIGTGGPGIGSRQYKKAKAHEILFLNLYWTQDPGP